MAVSVLRFRLSKRLELPASSHVSQCADILLDCWGYTIWRTVFTPGSDEKFAPALETTSQYVKEECFEDVERYPRQTNHAPCHEIWQCFENEIIEARDLEGVDPETVRKAFAAWIEGRGKQQNDTSRYRFCIVVEKGALETLCRFEPPPITGLPKHWQSHAVRVIDVEVEGEEDTEWPRNYQCSVMTPPWLLAHLYFWAHDLEPEEIRAGKEIPLYAFAE